MSRNRKLPVIIGTVVAGLAAMVHASPNESLNRTVRVGPGSAYTVETPSGWEAAAVRVTASFAPQHRPSDHEVRILVQLRKKCPTSSNAKEPNNRRDPLHEKCSQSLNDALNFSATSFRDLYGSAQVQNLAASHPKYPTVAELITGDESAYEYVVYLNPGKAEPWYFVFRLLTNRSASPEERAAFMHIVGSLKYVPAASTVK